MMQNYTAPTKTGVHKSWFFIPVFRFLPPVTPYFNKIRYFCVKRKSPVPMDQVIKLNAVEQYNKLYGLETRHPLVSVVNLNQARRNPEHFQVNYGLYALFLKDAHCGDILYGRQRYDYQDGTIVSFAPGQIVEVNRSAGPVSLDVHGLLFHPDLIRGTALGHDIKNYTFFSYEAREALHISEAERKIVLDCLDKIDTELRQGADRHSQRLITANINLLLDYCMASTTASLPPARWPTRMSLPALSICLTNTLKAASPCARDCLPSNTLPTRCASQPIISATCSAN